MTRDEAIEILEHNWSCLVNADYTEEECNKALHIAIEALEQYENAFEHGYTEAESKYREILERKRGEWLETSESIGWEEVGCAECSVCGKTLVLGDYTMDDIKFDYNYCPNCGARMEHD